MRSVIYSQLPSTMLLTTCQRNLRLFLYSSEVLPTSANSADDTRVDIAARGFWLRCEKAFFDVLIFNPYARTHRRQTLICNHCDYSMLLIRLWFTSRIYFAQIKSLFSGRPIWDTLHDKIWKKNMEKHFLSYPHCECPPCPPCYLDVWFVCSVLNNQHVICNN